MNPQDNPPTTPPNALEPYMTEPSREPQGTDYRLVTVFIHLTNGTIERFDGIDERSAMRVHLILGKNPRGELNILGRRYDREDIAFANIEYGS